MSRCFYESHFLASGLAACVDFCFSAIFVQQSFHSLSTSISVSCFMSANGFRDQRLDEDILNPSSAMYSMVVKRTLLLSKLEKTFVKESMGQHLIL